MNTVVSMFGNKSAIDTLRNEGYGGAGFDVASSPVLYRTKDSDIFSGIHSLNNKRVYYREDTGDALAIHGERYKPVSHKEMIDTARNVLERSELNLEGIKERIEVGDNGSVCFVRHLLPNHEIQTPDGDTAQMTMLHINSFNSVWPYQASAGAHQSACTNHQVFVTGAATIYKARHTQKLNVDHGARQLNGIIGMLDKQNEIWAKWANEELSDTNAFIHIAEAAGSKFAIGKVAEGERPYDIMNMPTAYNNSSLVYMWDKYLTHYRRNMGNNHWALYNTLTDWSSHHRGSRKNSVDFPVAQVKKSERVQKVISSFPFAQAA